MATYGSSSRACAMNRHASIRGRLALVLLSGALTSCQTGGEVFLGYETRESPVVEAIQVAATGTKGRPIEVQLVGQSGDTCWQAHETKVMFNEDEKIVVLQPMMRREKYLPARGCGAKVMDLSFSASFTPESSGTYHLQAKGWDPEKQAPTTWTAKVEVTE